MNDKTQNVLTTLTPIYLGVLANNTEYQSKLHHVTVYERNEIYTSESDDRVAHVLFSVVPSLAAKQQT